MEKNINYDYSMFLQQKEVSHSSVRRKLQYFLHLWKNSRHLTLKHHSMYLYHYKVHVIEDIIVDFYGKQHLWKLHIFLIEEQKNPNQIGLESKMPGCVEIHQLRMDILNHEFIIFKTR